MAGTGTYSKKGLYRNEFNKISKKIKNNSKFQYCQYCGKKAIHIHHLIPIALGGDNRLNNLIPLCIECHGLLHNKSYNKDWKELQTIGIEKAKAEGKFKGGSKIKLKLSKYKELKSKYLINQINKTQFSELLGVSRPTLNKILKNEEEYIKYWEE